MDITHLWMKDSKMKKMVLEIQALPETLAREAIQTSTNLASAWPEEVVLPTSPLPIYATATAYSWMFSLPELTPEEQGMTLSRAQS